MYMYVCVCVRARARVCIIYIIFNCACLLRKSTGKKDQVRTIQFLALSVFSLFSLSRSLALTRVRARARAVYLSFFFFSIGWERTEYFANVRTRYACFDATIRKPKQAYRVRTLAKYSVLSQPPERGRERKRRGICAMPCVLFSTSFLPFLASTLAPSSEMEEKRQV